MITLCRLTSGEKARGGAGLTIRVSSASTPFGPVVMASTTEGLMRLVFAGNAEAEASAIREMFPRADVVMEADAFHDAAMRLMEGDDARLTLHVVATDFEAEVWRALLALPCGRVATYSEVASMIGRPGACRAVASAIGRNSVAVIIPCHRVVRSDGTIGGYRWGAERKRALLRAEGITI